MYKCRFVLGQTFLELSYISEEKNNSLQYLDLTISRNNNNVEMNIYRKPTYTDIMIHYNSNHPYVHKLAAFIFYIHRRITMQITGHAVSR
jgi:hypothetical protein